MILQDRNWFVIKSIRIANYPKCKKLLIIYTKQVKEGNYHIDSIQNTKLNKNTTVKHEKLKKRHRPFENYS